MPSPDLNSSRSPAADNAVNVCLAEHSRALFQASWMRSATAEASALRHRLRKLHFHAETPFRCIKHHEKKPEPSVAPSDATGRELIALMEAEVSSELLLREDDGDGEIQWKRATAGDLLGLTPLFMGMLENARKTQQNPPERQPGRHQLGEIIGQGLEQNIPLRLLQLVISEMAETLHHIALYDAIQTYGPPPCDFMFMVMGSEGRFEQTLKTDQDNAIVFDGDEETHQPYFLKLGDSVNKALHAFGFDLCKGDVMAKNPKWCRSLDSWKQYFSNWIRTPKPMAVMQSTIFFDFKCGYGNPDFRRALRQHLREILSERADLFFYHLAQNTINNAIPLGLLGGLKYKSAEGLDLKKAMLPGVNYARLYALRHHIHHPNTLRRLQELKKDKVLPEQEIEELSGTYIFLMDLRLRHQLKLLKSNQSPDNNIIPEELPKETKEQLKQALKKMKRLQQHLRLEYSSGY